jgi:hypothetical protein
MISLVNANSLHIPLADGASDGASYGGPVSTLDY